MTKKIAKVKKTIIVSLILLLCYIPIFGQISNVSGKVFDKNKNPLIGVTVTVKGQTKGTITDLNGTYTLQSIDGNSTLIFSYVGFKGQEIKIENRKNIDVILEDSSIELNQVVVVGYGTQKKVNLTGAVSSVKVDEQISGRSIASTSTALQGLVPGLSVTQNSGMAGNNSSTLLIRGLGTINNANPLIVVDDMPDVDINRVNMNDIESITVLKDATASSVYGSRAANGVILIKTKSGKGKEKTKITFSGTYGWESPTKSYDFLSNYPKALTLAQTAKSPTDNTQANQYYKNGTIDQWLALGLIDPVKYPNTDWWNIIMRTGSIQNYNVSASGGSDKSNFYSSVGYMKQKGLQINNDYDRYNIRFNSDNKITKNVNTGFRFDGSSSNSVYALDNGFTSSAFNDMYTAIAGITPYDANKNVYGGVMAYGEDPMAYNPLEYFTNHLKKVNRQEANGAFYLDWEPIKGLIARIDYGLNYYNQFYKDADIPSKAYNFQTNDYGSRVYVADNAGVTNKTNTGYKTLLNARLNYHKLFEGGHDLSAMFVYSEEYWYDRYQMSYRESRLNPSLSEIDAALTTTQSTAGNSSSEGLRSYIARLNYTAFDKYLLEANCRVDGSSKFQPGHQFGIFPSVALGWRFTQENFIKKFTDSWLTYGKVRVSYGSLGNNSSVGRYEQQEVLTSSPYILNGSISNGYVYQKMLNPNLTWESTNVLNTGFDLAFINGKLTTELDYYDRLTTDMIQQSQMSILLTGAYTAPRTNIGSMRNRGVEANITWRDKISDFTYSVNFNVSYNQSTLEKWAEFLDKGSIYVNMPYYFLYTYKANGIAQTFTDTYNVASQGIAPGDVIRVDVNGDGKIDVNDKVAYQNYQTNMPTTNFGLNLQMGWKGFDLSTLLQGATGRKDFWLNNYNNVNPQAQRYAYTNEHWENPWSWDNRESEWPRLGGAKTNPTETTFWLQDMSYLRLKNIMLGYTLPKNFSQKFGIDNFRIYGSAENVLTLTNYQGLDPEKAGSKSDMYPISKSFSIGLNVSF